MKKLKKKKDEHYPVITTSLPNVANETQFYWNIAGTTLRCSPDLKRANQRSYSYQHRGYLKYALNKLNKTNMTTTTKRPRDTRMNKVL
jgi:hypothetical protein